MTDSITVNDRKKEVNLMAIELEQYLSTDYFYWVSNPQPKPNWTEYDICLFDGLQPVTQGSDADFGYRHVKKRKLKYPEGVTPTTAELLADVYNKLDLMIGDVEEGPMESTDPDNVLHARNYLNEEEGYLDFPDLDTVDKQNLWQAFRNAIGWT